MAFYPMKVKNEISAWPESGWRKRRWIRQDEMSEYLNSNSLRSLLEKFRNICKPVLDHTSILSETLHVRVLSLSLWLLLIRLWKFHPGVRITCGKIPRMD